MLFARYNLFLTMEVLSVLASIVAKTRQILEVLLATALAKERAKHRS